MKKIIRGLLVLIGVLALGTAALTVYKKIGGKETPIESAEYENLTVATLPIVFNEIAGEQVGVLHGYLDEQNMISAETPLIPVNQSTISLNVSLYGNELAAASYTVYNRGDETPLEQGEFTNWSHESDTIVCEAALTHILKENRDYPVSIRLTMKSGKSVWYYCRVQNASNLNAVAFIEYITGFHKDTFYGNTASKYSQKLEQDINADTQTLAEVKITSNVNQLSWDDMSPVEVDGTRTFTILEMDETFGSVQLQYEITSGDSEERFLVTEYLSLRYSKQVFYFMNYYRTMVELMSANDIRYADGNLDLGVSRDSDLNAAISDDGSWYAVGIGGEVWCYCPETKEVKRAFTFRDNDDLLRSGYREHEAKTLYVEDDGSVTFVIYGYMNRGEHEGRIGVSCMRYDAQTNHLDEKFFLPYKGMIQTLKKGVGTLAAMSSEGNVVILLGDRVYTIDINEHKMELMADNVGDKHLVVNKDQTVVAWVGQNEKGDRSETYIRYLDTGESQTLTAEKNQMIIPQGYIEDDCILAIRNNGETMELNGDLVSLYCGLIIRNREGSDEIKYAYDDIRINQIQVLTDQILLNRVRQTAGGGYEEIDSDTVMQNVGVQAFGKVPVTTTISWDRLRIHQIVGIGINESDEVKELSLTTSAGINYDASKAFVLEAAKEQDTELVYYAYGEGQLKSVCSTAGEAIETVFDAMGAVIDSDGRMIWYRTSRSERVDLDVRGRKKVEESECLKRCMLMAAATEGVNLPETSLTDDMTAMAMMNAAVPGRALNLTGAPLRSLLYYLDRGCMLVVIDKEQHAMAMIGFDPWNVRYYDPVIGKVKVQGQKDATAFLAEGCTVIGYSVMTK